MGKHNLCMILVSLTLDVVGTAGLGSLEQPMLLLLISGHISFLSNCTPIVYEMVVCLYLPWFIL
jgi:hypothetical protein